MNKDYSQAEIDSMVNTLLNEHQDKLKHQEIVFLECARDIQRLSDEDYDVLRSMYDRMAEGGY